MANFILHPFTSISHGIGRITASFIVRFRDHRRLLVSLAGIGAVLLLAPVMGILVARGVNPIFVFAILLLPLVVLAVHFILPRHELGPIFVLISAAFVPIKLPTGTESTIVDSLLLTTIFVGNWLLMMIIVDKRLSLKASLANKPLLGFIGMIIVSLIWSIMFKDPLVDPSNLTGKFVFVQSAAAFTSIMLPMAFLLVANCINEVKWLKVMAGIMLIAGVLAASPRLDLVSFGVNDGGLFSMWIVGLSTGLALFAATMPKMVRGLLLGLGGIWLYIRFFLGITWLAGWLPSLIILGILMMRRSKTLLLTTVIVGAVFLVLNFDYFDKVFAAESDESGGTRMAAWSVNWRVTGKHLVFGTGPAGYAAYYMTYFPTEGMATHNNVIDILAQHGIIGLALCLWFFIALAWQGYKLCLRLQGRSDFVEALANIAFAGTIGCLFMMVFGDWLFPFVYTQTIAGFDYIVYSWLFMGMIPVLERLADPDA